MTDAQNEQPDRQDPAEPNEVDTSVETNEQPPSDDAPKAPEPAEPDAVTVTPEDQSGTSLLGKDYDVSPDRGFRVKS